LLWERVQAETEAMVSNERGDLSSLLVRRREVVICRELIRLIGIVNGFFFTSRIITLSL
jgi:hypothetical protein